MQKEMSIDKLISSINKIDWNYFNSTWTIVLTVRERRLERLRIPKIYEIARTRVFNSIRQLEILNKQKSRRIKNLIFSENDIETSNRSQILSESRDIATRYLETRSRSLVSNNRAVAIGFDADSTCRYRATGGVVGPSDLGPLSYDILMRGKRRGTEGENRPWPLTRLAAATASQSRAFHRKSMAAVIRTRVIQSREWRRTRHGVWSRARGAGLSARSCACRRACKKRTGWPRYRGVAREK